MPFTKKPNFDFKIENNKIVLGKDYLFKNKKYFKKITGSRLASILGLNSFTTPVKTWAIMTNIFKDEMDPTLLETGIIIEPKIKKYVERKLNIHYLTYDPIKVKFDIFNDNDIFGGIPDGEPIELTGKINYDLGPMLEIKTSSYDAFVFKNEKNVLKLMKDSNNIPLVKVKNKKYESWFNEDKINIPTEYAYQLGLYMFLRKINNGLFAVSFIEKQYYANPNAFIPNEKNTYLINFKINNIDSFSKKIDQAREWYQKYILTGISPELTPEDMKWIKNELDSYGK